MNSTNPFLHNFKKDMRAIVAPDSSIPAALLSLDGVNTLPKNYAWVNWTRLRNACRRRHKEIEKEMRKRREAIDTDRSKRDASSMFLVPGTKWCGKGYSADKYTRLGGFSRTDRCCRKHDLACPFWIGAFETKYGLFNWRMNTLMHCNCDER
nr:unnamed protein product [Callosobruchus chinensis]